MTTLDPDKPPKADGKADFTKDFFHKPAYLTVSGQLQVESFACSLGKVYTFGPTFRAENSNTPRHLAEFWMIEPEMAFYELTDNMDLAEAFLKRIIGDALKFCAEDMKFFQERIDKELLARLDNVLNNPFKRVSYTEGVDILLKSGKTWEFPVAWGTDLQSEHERYLAEQHFKCPVILYDYPRTLKPFYMKVNDDGKTVRAMDVLVPGVGEIIGGSQREERLDVLESRMREQGLDPQGYEWYLDLRKLRHGAARRLRPRARAHDPVPQRHGEHPRRDPVPAHARQRRVLVGAASRAAHAYESASARRTYTKRPATPSSDMASATSTIFANSSRDCARPGFRRATFAASRVGRAWVRVVVRRVELRGEPHLQFSYFDGRQDVTKNYSLGEAHSTARRTAVGFGILRQSTSPRAAEEIDIHTTKKGKVRRATDGRVNRCAEAHNRAKNVPLPEGRADRLLEVMGIMTPDGRVRPTMRAKYAQINEFLKQLLHVLDDAGLRSAGRELEILDCGCGSSYLTLAVHHYLNDVLGIPRGSPA